MENIEISGRTRYKRPYQGIKWLITACAVIFLSGCDETMRSEYRTVSEASSEIERGWIPSILPPSTTDIREVHDLDTNRGEGKFTFSSVDANRFKSDLTPLKENKLPPKCERLKREGYDFYSYKDFTLAINWEQCAGLFWTPHP